MSSPQYPILIVEDRDSLRIMLRRTLESRGHAVVEARDQVLIIFFWPASFISVMRFMRRSSTNGPFLADLLKRCLLPYPRLPRLRPRIMSLSDCLWFARVR